MSQNNDFNSSIFDSFELYNEDINNFFKTNYIVKKTFHTGERLDRGNTNSVQYLNSGLIKVYNINLDGNEVFTGYIPLHSTMYTSPGLNFLGKYSVAAVETEIYYCKMNDYLSFLQESPDRLLHALHEPYYRRNLNSLPTYEAIGQSLRFKVYNYIYYVANRFGIISNNDSNKVIVINPPSYIDIANFNSVHPSNVSTCFSELKNAGILSKGKNKITLDMQRLEKALDYLRK